MNVIEVQNLSKIYGKLVAIKGINFTVQQGEIFGLIGPDGAGKTSTFHILSGVMESTSGQVEILGQSPRNVRPFIGYLTQQFSLYLDLSINENLRYTAGLHEIPTQIFNQRRIKYLNLMDLLPFRDRLAGQLSGGMKQKLALCCALISHPQILLLDEPTTGVDPVSRREFWDILAAIAYEGVTIVVATPYLDEAERCHRLALMYEGEIQETGTLTQLRENLGLHRLEIHTEHLYLAESSLINWSKNQANTSLVDVQIFGDHLDVLVNKITQGEAEVREILAQHHIVLNNLQVVAPTLENVFVTRLRNLGDDPPFIPFPKTRTSQNYEQDSIAIKAQDLNKIFGNFSAVRNINLEVKYGEIYGLLGANGAGKTTTIKMLCGLLSATSGVMSLAGKTRDLRSSALRQRLGYMSQKFTLYNDLTILENLEFYCGVYGVSRRLRRQKIDWVLATCGLIGKEQMLTGKLPGGWKQRVAFGASILHEPEILFLDEPTSGVDPLARRQFWRLINELARQGTAILVTTHYLEEAEECNRLGLMVAGELVIQGSPREIKASQPGQSIEMLTDNPQIASNLLKTQLAAWRVSIFGDRLHLVLDDPDTELSQIQTLFTANQLPMHALRAIPFSLEDAFIGIVQRAQRSS